MTQELKFEPIYRVRPNAPGFLLALEGLDGCGKATQAQMLKEHYEAEYGPDKVQVLRFPDYTSKTGVLIRQYLDGGYGDLDAYAAASLYAMNRYEWKAEIEGWLDEGKLVILDRYVYSNAAYQYSRFADRKDADRFEHWLMRLEYQENHLPVPNLTIFIDLPVEEAMRRVGGRNIPDKHERDKNLLQGARAYYKNMAWMNSPGWAWVRASLGPDYNPAYLNPEEVFSILNNTLKSNEVFEEFAHKNTLKKENKG